jgi:hypothetical protein
MSAASQPDDQSEVRAARAAFMRAHFAAGVQLHDAIARGDLEAARRQARQLAEHRPDVPFSTGAAVFFTLMQNAAGEVERAPTVEVAARATAVLLTRCGQCHAAQHAAPRVASHLDSAALVAPAMREHQAAADLLLIGLIEPSDASWEAGARDFGRIRLPGDAMPNRRLRARALIGDARLTGLASKAAAARRPPDRAQLYGRVLSTCAHCHQEHDIQRWGPDRRPPA